MKLDPEKTDQRWFFLLIFLGITLTLGPVFGHAEVNGVEKIVIESASFQESSAIPAKYTCDDQDISPPLKWSGVPKNTKSLAMISDDPDAPMGDWVHWVIYNLPPTLTELPEGIPATEKLPTGGLQGRTDFGRIGYGGPCPPSGTHRYFFKIYALDTELSLASGKTKRELLQAMEGHVLAMGQLMGKYQRTSMAGGRR